MQKSRSVCGVHAGVPPPHAAIPKLADNKSQRISHLPQVASIVDQNGTRPASECLSGSMSRHCVARAALCLLVAACSGAHATSATAPATTALRAGSIPGAAADLALPEASDALVRGAPTE